MLSYQNRRFPSLFFNTFCLFGSLVKDHLAMGLLVPLALDMKNCRLSTPIVFCLYIYLFFLCALHDPELLRYVQSSSSLRINVYGWTTAFISRWDEWSMLLLLSLSWTAICGRRTSFQFHSCRWGKKQQQQPQLSIFLYPYPLCGDTTGSIALYKIERRDE